MRIDEDMSKRPTNWLRRIIGATVAMSPLVLLIVSTVVGFVGNRPSRWSGVGLVIAAAAIALLNFHLSFIRPRVFFRRHGSIDGYRFISGFPGIGTIPITVGAIWGFGSVGTALLGIAAFCLDTGGSGWGVIATWGDSSLWDG